MGLAMSGGNSKRMLDVMRYRRPGRGLTIEDVRREAGSQGLLDPRLRGGVTAGAAGHAQKRKLTRGF